MMMAPVLAPVYVLQGVCAIGLKGSADARTGGIFSLLGWSPGQISAFGNKLMYNAAKRRILWRRSGGCYPGCR